MPLSAALSVHTVDLLRPTITQTSSMTAQRDYTATTTQLKCRIGQVAASQREKLQRSGYQVNYQITFAFDPKLKLSDRLRWNGTIIRIIPPYNQQGIGTLWVVYVAIANSDDMPTVDELE